jgi:hypothetical protein
MGDRRYELRLLREDSVDLRWKDQFGKTQSAAAYLANISSSGASLQAQRPVRVGTVLSLDYQDQKLTGTVKHCVLRGTIYRLGVEFKAGGEWSPPRQ